MNSRNQIYTQPLAVRDVNIGSADDPVGRNTIIGLLKALNVEMVVFQGSYTYFTQSMTQYDSPFDKVTNQVELDDLLIRNYIAIKNSYVTDAAFKGVQAIVGVCLEDWPMAIGSVFSVVTDIWKYIGMGNMQGTPSTPQTASILERLDAIEQFLSSQGYIPPSPSNSSP